MHTSQIPSHQQIVLQEVPTSGEPQAVALSLPQRVTHARGSREEATGKWAVLVLVGIGIFMATLDTSIGP